MVAEIMTERAAEMVAEMAAQTASDHRWHHCRMYHCRQCYHRWLHLRQRHLRWHHCRQCHHRWCHCRQHHQCHHKQHQAAPMSGATSWAVPLGGHNGGLHEGRGRRMKGFGRRFGDGKTEVGAVLDGVKTMIICGNLITL